MHVCTHKTLHKSVQTFLFCFTSNTLISLTTSAWLKDTFSSSHWFQQSYLCSFLPSVLREHEMCYSAFTSQMDITSARTSFEFNLQQEKAKQIPWYCTSHIVQTWNTEISLISTLEVDGKHLLLCVPSSVWNCIITYYLMVFLEISSLISWERGDIYLYISIHSLPECI